MGVQSSRGIAAVKGRVSSDQRNELTKRISSMVFAESKYAIAMQELRILELLRAILKGDDAA
jgi:hypothetical protein